MSTPIYSLTTIVITLASISCGGERQGARNGGVPSAGRSNSEQTTTAANVAGQPADPNASANTSAAVPKRRTVVDHPADGPPPAPQFQPAGEDSQVAVTMRPDGSIYEIRIFKSHAQLSKVEASWNGVSEKTLKITLRNGRVIERTTDHLQNLQTASTHDLLKIAGLAPAVPADRPADKKKRG